MRALKRTKVLVTGASGFIGKPLMMCLQSKEGFLVRGAVRQTGVDSLAEGIDLAAIGDISATTNWKSAVEGIDVIVHTAAKVHVIEKSGKKDSDEFHNVNVAGTLNLARQAVQNGVRRFVYLSSIKVNGDVTKSSIPFTEDDEPNPQDTYAKSKAEAEAGLWEISKQSCLEIVIIRPTLVYGPGVKANFLNLLKMLSWRIPLPFGTIQNQRSLLALDNLLELLTVCCVHAGAANQIFLAADGIDVSTTDLLSRMGFALNKPARLIPFPLKALEILMKFAGKEELFNKLGGSLQVDIEKTKRLLDWSPPVTIDEGFHDVAQWFLNKVTKVEH